MIYKNLLTTQQFLDQQIQKRKSVLDSLEHKVSHEMAESLVKEISSTEVRATLVVVGKKVCPRNYGLSPEFFLEYWDDIADAFTTALFDWNEGMIYLIPKVEGVVDDIKKWRPITILNTIYKVYAKLLVTRLQPFFHILYIKLVQALYRKGVYLIIFSCFGR